MKKKISIVTPCYNEELNIELLVEAIACKMLEHPDFCYEHIFIDNDSTDKTREILRTVAKKNSFVKVIFNTRNFGHIRSPVHGILQADGDAVILMASDFQDPIDLISDFIKGWQEGFHVVIAVKAGSRESWLLYNIRKMFYKLMNRISDIKLVKNYTGTGLYDRMVVDALKQVQDPYPYFRGLIADLGFKAKRIYFEQPTRKRGISKNNFFTLYDMAMTGIVGYSRLPLRIVTLIGFVCSVVFFCVGIYYLVFKLIFWREIEMGIAPTIIGLGFFGSVQMFILGFIGEYVGQILTQVQKRPLVIEEERINFLDSSNVSENQMQVE